MSSKRIVLFALLLTAGFALQGCSDSGLGGDSGSKPEVRLLNASIGYESLDLYVSTDDDEEDSLEIEAVQFGSVSDYVKLSSDTYVIKVKRAGATSTLYTVSDVNLSDASHTTLVASGRSGELTVQVLDEDLGEPDDGDSKISLVNASGAGSLDVYLTEESEDLEDASPITFSAATTIDSDTYRLRVTGSGDTDDLRLDVSEFALDSEQVSSVIFTATQGGVLVNAYFLPQQGALEKFLNGKSRVRGAVGLASGSSATLEIGDAQLLTNAATGVIGNRYWQVDAGSVPVELSVSGVPIDVGNLDLEAGADYTFLVLDEAGSIGTRLIADDNFLPDSTKGKVRLLHGMAGLDQPITLTVDFFPIIEGLERGEASDYIEIDSGLEYQYDVSNAYTTTIIWTRDSVALQDDGVYTLFVSGGDPTVNGSLRKDR